MEYADMNNMKSNHGMNPTNHQNLSNLQQPSYATNSLPNIHRKAFPDRNRFDPQQDAVDRQVQYDASTMRNKIYYENKNVAKSHMDFLNRQVWIFCFFMKIRLSQKKMNIYQMESPNYAEIRIN